MLCRDLPMARQAATSSFFSRDDDRRGCPRFSFGLFPFLLFERLRAWEVRNRTPLPLPFAYPSDRSGVPARAPPLTGVIRRSKAGLGPPPPFSYRGANHSRDRSSSSRLSCHALAPFSDQMCTSGRAGFPFFFLSKRPVVFHGAAADPRPVSFSAFRFSHARIDLSPFSPFKLAPSLLSSGRT